MQYLNYVVIVSSFLCELVFAQCYTNYLLLGVHDTSLFVFSRNHVKVGCVGFGGDTAMM